MSASSPKEFNRSVTSDPKRTGEHNDCAVVAHANVCRVSYACAHFTLELCGRRPRRGTYATTSVDALKQATAHGHIAGWSQIGLLYSCVGYYRRPKNETVAQIVRRLPRQGRYMLMAGGHCFAYIDGELCDNLERSKMRARVNRCYKVELPASVTPAIARFDSEKESITQDQINELWARLDRLEGK